MSWIMSCQGSQTGESTAAVRDSSLVKLKAEKEESRPTDEGDMHWVHTERVYDNHLAEYGSEGTYPSDEDGDGSCMSDEDN